MTQDSKLVRGRRSSPSLARRPVVIVVPRAGRGQRFGDRSYAWFSGNATTTLDWCRSTRPDGLARGER